MRINLCCTVSRTPKNWKALIDAYDEWRHWPDFNIPTPHTYLCNQHLKDVWVAWMERNKQYVKQQHSANSVALEMDDTPMADVVPITMARDLLKGDKNV